jgi:hypothetical protein
VGPCTYHDHYPSGDATAPATDENPIMAELEPDHLVTCATVDEEGGCVQNKTPKAA